MPVPGRALRRRCATSGATTVSGPSSRLSATLSFVPHTDVLPRHPAEPLRNRRAIPQAPGGAGGARIVVEKPFGHDLASARRLNGLLERIFVERDIYRIDHFLGKESVESVLYFRFANAFAEPLLRHEHVASVQVTMAEDFGVADRGSFYDGTGAIRDVIQNHLLEVTAIVAMEPPTRHADDPVRDAKATAIKAMRPLTPSDTVRGQYRGYRRVPGVSPQSTTETYAA